MAWSMKYTTSLMIIWLAVNISEVQYSQSVKVTHSKQSYHLTFPSSGLDWSPGCAIHQWDKKCQIHWIQYPFRTFNAWNVPLLPVPFPALEIDLYHWPFDMWSWSLVACILFLKHGKKQSLHFIAYEQQREEAAFDAKLPAILHFPDCLYILSPYTAHTGCQPI